MPATIALTVIAMLAFAGNSLLARLALVPGVSGGGIDASGFTLLRLASGGLALGLWLLWRRGGAVLRHPPGNWLSAVCLLAYAGCFSFAYLELAAATGALILFTAVQATMVAIAVARGDRPTAAEGLGLAAAFGGFVYLMLPRARGAGCGGQRADGGGGHRLGGVFAARARKCRSAGGDGRQLRARGGDRAAFRRSSGGAASRHGPAGWDWPCCPAW